tara:strand:+ start:161 stop:388 length:228 start_codon:yes stop_codon:yes gene_type:complete
VNLNQNSLRSHSQNSKKVANNKKTNKKKLFKLLKITREPKHTNQKNSRRDQQSLTGSFDKTMSKHYAQTRTIKKY